MSELQEYEMANKDVALDGVESGETKNKKEGMVTQEELDAVTYASICEELKVWSKDPQRVMYTFMRMCLVAFLLYCFLFFLDLMGTSFKVLGGCAGGELFDGLDNPIAGLMVGILATVFVQSSSTSTSIVVSLVGAGSMKVKTAIPVIMGANIGTSVTNTIVSMYYVTQGDHLERAFAGATVHDMFNMCSVAVLLPLELIITWIDGNGGLLYHFSDAVKPSSVEDGDKWEGPLKKIVAPITAEFLLANKDVMKSVANGATTCEEIYDTHKDCTVEYNQTTFDGCSCSYQESVCPSYVKGLIKDGNINAWDNKGQGAHAKPYYITPMFWDKYATLEEDMASATATLIISLIGLCTCMAALVKVLSYVTQNSNQAMLKKAAAMDPYVAIGVGTGITVLVQSSSVTTSVLTPLAASDIISLEQMLPLTLGANIGTTATSILASLVSAKVEAVQIAIVHLTFNILGIIIWFGLPIPCKDEGGSILGIKGWSYVWPVPFPYKKEDGKQLQMRDVPLNAARALGRYTRTWNTFPIYYIITMFVVIPGILFGISSLFEGKAAYQALGWIVLMFLLFFICRIIYWFRRQNGRQEIIDFMERRQKKLEFNRNLMNTVAALQAEVAALKGNDGSTL